MFDPHTEFNLGALGVGPVAERVYLHLIDTGSGQSAPQIARQTSTPLSAVKEALRQLERQHLVVTAPTASPTYGPRPPAPALESLVARLVDELAQVRLYGRELQDRFREGGDHRSPTELLEVVVGEREVLRHYEELLSGAQSEISVFTKPPYVVPGRSGDVNAVLTRESEGIARGVRYRTVYDGAAVDEPFTLSLAQDSIALGEQARLALDLPMKLLLMDRSIGFLPLRTEAPQAGSLIVRPSPLLDALVALFETVWARSVPLGPSSGNDKNMDERSRQILTLMSGGLKDDSIARALGISRRTVQKRVSQLMETLGARTRFQAALRAHERGWMNDA